MGKSLSNCPSCGSEASGAYCPACGEKIVRDSKEFSFSYFLKDAVEEVFNFDSKFLRTLRMLATRPGFLTTEILAGRKVLYIKPFRLFALTVVVHFLLFSFFQSGDLFAVDRFPIFKIMPSVLEMIHDCEVKSGLTHEAFTAALNPKIKDNLNIIFNLLVFVLALYFKLLYYKSGKYYIEHLYFLFHLISFGLLRNIVIIPLLMFDWIWVAFVISFATQLPYTFIAMRKVYGESVPQTLVKVVLGMLGFVMIFIPGMLLATAIGILQIGGL